MRRLSVCSVKRLLPAAALWVAVACLLGSPADAAICVVDQGHPDAADENPGTEARPWKTLQHAAQAARPGDTVLVLPGVYRASIRPAASGTAEEPIVYRAVSDGSTPEGAVVVEGGGLGFNLQNLRHLRVEGFEVRKTEGDAVRMDGSESLVLVGNHIHHTGGSGVMIQAATDCLIRENYIHHVGTDGVHAGGLTMRAVRVTIERNHIHDNGVEDGIQIGGGEDCVIAHNYVHDIWAPAPSHTDAIQLHSGNRNYRIIGNVCHRIRSEGFMCGAENSTKPSAPTYIGNIMSDGGGVSFIVSRAIGSTWLHNTVLWGRWQSLWIHEGSTGATVRGNLWQSPGGGCVVADDSAAGLTLDYNLTAGDQGTVGPHGKRGDPMLVEPKQAGAPKLPNVRLRPGSPAIDAGPDGSDIGALEYPNVYYVDPRHPAATDEFYGYRALPFKTLARACEVARPGETIVLREGTYRETLAPRCDDITVRAMEGEKVFISGADRITGWRRDEHGWSAALDVAPRTLLRDGERWTDYTYDAGAKRLKINWAADPRLNLFETIVRQQGIDLAGRRNVRIEGVQVVHKLD